jgi:hypothetical protein
MAGVNHDLSTWNGGVHEENIASRRQDVIGRHDGYSYIASGDKDVLIKKETGDAYGICKEEVSLVCCNPCRYRGMQQTDKQDALRKAQLATRKKYPHPYYWASFQLTGSAR